MTLDLPPGRGDQDLRFAMATLQLAWSRFWKAYSRWLKRRFPRAEIAGLRGYEVPWRASRWHPHVHLLLRVPAAAVRRSDLLDRWQRAVSTVLTAVGEPDACLHYRAVDSRPVVRGSENRTARYVLKGDVGTSKQNREALFPSEEPMVPPEALEDYVRALTVFRGHMVQRLGHLRRRKEPEE